MVQVVEAKENATVVFDVATGEPRMVVVDASDLDDPAFWQYADDVNREETVQIDVPVEIYNSSIKNPAGVHEVAVAYARQEYEKQVLTPIEVG